MYFFPFRIAAAVFMRVTAPFCNVFQFETDYKNAPLVLFSAGRGERFAAIRARLKSGYGLKNRRNDTSLVLFVSAIVERTGGTNGQKSCKIITERQAGFAPNGQGFFMRVYRPSRGWWLVQADKEPRLHLEKGAAAAALHRADRYIRAGASRGRTPAMISGQEGATQAFFKNRAALCGPRPPAPLKILPHWTPSKHRAAHPSAWAGVGFP